MRPMRRDSASALAVLLHLAPLASASPSVHLVSFAATTSRWHAQPGYSAIHLDGARAAAVVLLTWRRVVADRASEAVEGTQTRGKEVWSGSAATMRWQRGRWAMKSGSRSFLNDTPPRLARHTTNPTNL
ncbi:hypothetical protein RTBOTA2_005927 [Rhodotorula toruloides]|nr:hypothetical protein RTBOTA2_005927 [Rhodotorula toruloides]